MKMFEQISNTIVPMPRLDAAKIEDVAEGTAIRPGSAGLLPGCRTGVHDRT
jgi:hypothetical protein